MNLGAKQAREILEDRSNINAEMWYEKHKYDLFELIQNNSLKGINSMLLESLFWNDEEYKRKHLLNQLKFLGYSVTGNDKTLTITW